MSPAGEAPAEPALSAAARNASLRSFMTISLAARRERHPLPVLGAGVDGGRTDDFTVDSLLDDMRGPAGGARNHENRGEHRGGHAHHVVRHRTIPVQVG